MVSSRTKYRRFLRSYCGSAFLALANSVDPGSIDMSAVDPEAAEENVDRGMSLLLVPS